MNLKLLTTLAGVEHARCVGGTPRRNKQPHNCRNESAKTFHTAWPLTFVLRHGGPNAPSIRQRRNPAVASSTMVGLRHFRFRSECLRRIFSLRVFRIKPYISASVITQPNPYSIIDHIGVRSENLPSGGKGI
jgi:hypothetical protein